MRVVDSSLYDGRDVERLDRAVFQAAGHQSIINAIDGLGGLGVGVGAAELATAGRDGLVQVWDVRQQVPGLGFSDYLVGDSLDPIRWIKFRYAY